MAETPDEVFAEMRARIDPAKAKGKNVSYRFDVAGAGSWRVDLDDGRVTIEESAADADCVIQASEETFMRIVRGQQNPVTAYMTGKVKVRGDTGLALQLRDLFG